ncbi:MAG: hypothetical protein R6X20_12605 [Phycisphaerae bacterium]
MKRRGRRSSPISLFAFQDIMASVIGMVFIVVLVMALDIVHAKTTGAAIDWQDVTDADVQRLQARVEELNEQVREAKADIQRLSDRLDLASGDEVAALDKVKRLEATLKSLYERIREGQETLEQSDTVTARLVREAHEAKQQADRLDDRIDDLREQLKSARAAPRLAFIIDPHPDRLQPWLLEVSGSSLRVASKDGSSVVMEFRGASAEQRKARFLAWLSTQSPSTHYFVLLVKPTGVVLSDELQRTLRDRGFDIGKDLLPADWNPFRR